jgi:WD40 repeat protein
VPAAAAAAAAACGGRARSACRSPNGISSSGSSSRPVAISSAFTVLKGHVGSVTGLAVASDSGVLVSCGADGQVLQWDYCRGQLLGGHSMKGQSLSCVAVEPDARLVYVGTTHGQLLTVAVTEQPCGAEAKPVEVSL